MHLRRTTSSDLAALVELDAACFSKPWGREGILGELQAEEGLGWIVFSGEKARMGALALEQEQNQDQPQAIGFAFVRMFEERFELLRIGVLASCRKRGVAKVLMNELLEEARRARQKKGWLEVASQNLAAIGLYRSVGFVQVGKRPGYYRNPIDDALLMEICM